MDFCTGSFSGQTSGNLLRQSVEAYQEGNYQKAFELIVAILDSGLDPRFYAYRASLYLAVGHVEKANLDIDRMLQANPHDNNALALQTIIKVV